MTLSANGTPVYARQHAAGLTLQQQNAVDLLVSGKNDTETAELLGLHRTTITKWRLYDRDFQTALMSRRAEVWGAGVDRLRSLISQALNVLGDAMADPKSPDRLKAANAVLRLVDFPPLWLTDRVVVRRPTDADEENDEDDDDEDDEDEEDSEIRETLRGLSDSELIAMYERFNGRGEADGETGE
jgi:hypothetical protein